MGKLQKKPGRQKRFGAFESNNDVFHICASIYLLIYVSDTCIAILTTLRTTYLQKCDKCSKYGENVTKSSTLKQ